MFAIVFGGSGSPDPMMELLVQLTATVAASVIIVMGRFRGERPDSAILLLAALGLVLPVVQLLPLPPAIWQVLPGRENAMGALALIGQDGTWKPISLATGETLASLLAWGPPLLVLIYVASIPVAERGASLVAVAIGALASVAVGVGQLAGSGLRLYHATHEGWITGFQANRNATADILLVGILAIAAVTALRRPIRKQTMLLAGASVIVLGIAVVMTGSRTGIALCVPVLIAAAVLILSVRDGTARNLVRGAVAVSAMLALAGGAVASSSMRRAIGRFGESDDFRWELWTDAWSAALAYWPMGGGIGAFVQLFMPFERLEVVDRTAPNRAHNDYLEWLIEAGLPGLVVAGLVVFLLGLLNWRSLRTEEVPVAHRFFAIGTILTIAAHSLVDYPLRSMSLACLFALAVAMLSAPVSRRRPSEVHVNDAA